MDTALKDVLQYLIKVGILKEWQQADSDGKRFIITFN